MIHQSLGNSKDVTVSTSGLSPEAVAYLRRQMSCWRREGCEMKRSVVRAQSWCGGYQLYAVHPGLRHDQAALWMASPEFVDGYQFAHGEHQYNQCMAVDKAQNSADAAGWPTSF